MMEFVGKNLLVISSQALNLWFNRNKPTTSDKKRFDDLMQVMTPAFVRNLWVGWGGFEIDPINQGFYAIEELRNEQQYDEFQNKTLQNLEKHLIESLSTVRHRFFVDTFPHWHKTQYRTVKNRDSHDTQEDPKLVQERIERLETAILDFEESYRKFRKFGNEFFATKVSQ